MRDQLELVRKEFDKFPIEIERWDMYMGHIEMLVLF